MKKANNCENCSNYGYDEDYRCYVCEKDLDEDEMERFLCGRFSDCPYFSREDDYSIVRKQI